jgi:hypothetical protein
VQRCRSQSTAAACRLQSRRPSSLCSDRSASEQMLQQIDQHTHTKAGRAEVPACMHSVPLSHARCGRYPGAGGASFPCSGRHATARAPTNTKARTVTASALSDPMSAARVPDADRLRRAPDAAAVTAAAGRFRSRR